MPVREFLQFLVVSNPLRVRKSAMQHPCRSHTSLVWVPQDINVIGDSREGPERRPCGHRTGSYGDLRFIWSKHKRATVSNCTGTAAWCEYRNIIVGKFLQAFHSASWKKILQVLKIIRSLWFDMTETLQKDQTTHYKENWRKLSVHCRKTFTSGLTAMHSVTYTIQKNSEIAASFVIYPLKLSM